MDFSSSTLELICWQMKNLWLELKKKRIIVVFWTEQFGINLLTNGVSLAGAMAISGNLHYVKQTWAMSASLVSVEKIYNRSTGSSY